jgi:RNA polymerase sigma-70 factor (ECF subfamily)
MDDGFLIRQVLGGHRDAFRLLVIRYQRPLFRFLGGFGFEQAAVEELAQETFLRAYRRLVDWDAAKSSFSSWLFTIAKHLALNEGARSRRRQAHVELSLELPSEGEGAAPDAIAERERSHRLGRALERLPQLLRSALVLAYLKEHSMEEIAAIEGCSVGAVKSRIFRGKQQLLAAYLELEKST